MRTLLEDGYLDDARFALMFVQDKRELEDWGSERIRRELAARGRRARSDRDRLGAARSRVAGERERARPRAGAPAPALPAPPRDRRERDRALGVLIRKGFDSELALDALAAYARGATEASHG